MIIFSAPIESGNYQELYDRKAAPLAPLWSVVPPLGPEAAATTSVNWRSPDEN